MNTIVWLLIFLFVSVGSFYAWSVYFQSSVNSVVKLFSWLVAFVGMHVSMLAWLMFQSSFSDSVLIMLITYTIVSSPIFVIANYWHSKSRWYTGPK